MRPNLFVTISLLVLLSSLLLAGCAPAAAQSPASTVQSAAEPTVAAAATAVAPTQAAVKSAWEIVLQIEVEQPLRMAAFLDESFGVTGGPTDSKAYYTNDGGATWTKTESSGRCIYGLDIVDAQVVWQCGAHATSVSIDGAQTWEAMVSRRSGGHGCRLSFADAETGWFFGVRTILTTDGGVTWEDVALPEGVSLDDVAGILLRTANDGYILDYSGVLHVTRDGGNSWSSITLVLDEYEAEGLKLLPLDTNPAIAMRFFDAQNGVVILNLLGGGQSKIIALRTADGGQTWEEEDVPAPIGTPYLTRDGGFLTIHSFFDTGQVTVLRYHGN